MEINIKIDKPTNLRYDNSLYDVYVLDYGDNYHRTSDQPSSEFELEVRRLKARYRDLSKFREALYIYNEWMAYLETKHGGRDLLKKKIAANVIDDYVPRKPRLKNVKTLKYLYKNNILVSKVGKTLIMEEELDDFIEAYYSDESIDKEKIVIDTVKDKNVKNIVKEIDSSIGIRTIKSRSFKSDADFLESFFMSKNKTKKGKKGKKYKKDKKEKILLKDWMRSDYHPDVEDSDESPMTLYDGLLLSTGTTREMDTYHKIDAAGWNSYKIMKKANYSKRVTSMFKAKHKKKNKKKEYDDLLIDIMTDNGYDDFEEFNKEMLNMTSENVFN